MKTETQPRLSRVLGVTALTLFGITYMNVLAVFTTYGFASATTNGLLPAAYVLAVLAMLFTAISYGLMVRRYPVAGSAYTYTQKSFGGKAGFLTGWIMLLDYLFLPIICFLLIGIYLNTQFPSIPAWVFALVSLLLVLAFNILGINLVNKVNFAILGLSVLLTVVFVALAFKHALGGDLSVGLAEPFLPGEDGLGPIAAGAGILALSFLGFDAVSTLSEEAKRPRKDIPRAIVITTLLGGTFFILISWAGALAYSPDWSSLSPAELDAAGVTVMENIGGEAFTLFFVAAYVVSVFGCAMTSQVSVSRILFAMGRDGILPKPLSRLHRRYATPFIAAIAVSIIGLLSLVLTLDVVAYMISFGALAAFAMVNLSVIRTYIFPKGGRKEPLSATRVLLYLVVPAIGFALTIWLWTSLESLTWVVGLSWFAVGMVIIAIATRGFKRPVPQLDLLESEPACGPNPSEPAEMLSQISPNATNQRPLAPSDD